MADRAPESTIRPIEANHISFFTRFGRLPDGHLSTMDGITKFSSGVDYAILNGVFTSDTAVPERSIRETIAWFRDQGLPFYWWVLSGQRSPDFLRRLETAGLHRAFEAPGMSLDLDQLGPPPQRPSGLRLEPVADESGYEMFGRTLNAGDFQAPAPIARSLPRLLRPDPGDSRFRFLLGFLDDEAVATSLCFVSDGAVGIYGIATVPGARRRGIGMAMTRAALESSREICREPVAVLTATELGYPIYLRVGFKEVCRLLAYALPEAGNVS